MQCLATPRLDLILATVDLLEAELESHTKLSSLLHASIPEDWPPGEYNLPAIKYFRDQLVENPGALGWYSWYALLHSTEETARILIGAGGFIGPPNDDGQLEIGYSIIPKFKGHGYASELVSSLVEYAFNHKHVKRIIAHTAKENIGSVKVLERTGFHLVGFGKNHDILKYERKSLTV
jgi:RimJ/RimL family protein N-acetyltransferase